MAIRTIGALLGILLVAGCESAYYSAMEQVGVHKRDILVDRVDEASEAQEDAKEEFQSALEKFTSVVEVPPSDLKDSYENLAEAFEDSQSRADLVSERIDAVESVSEHNLNAQAISSLQGELNSIQSDVAVLITDMEASIAKSQAFIEDMELLGGSS